MHRYDPTTDELARTVVDYALQRVRMHPPPLDAPRSAEELARVAGPTVTEEGLGGLEALRIFKDVLAPATVSIDHPRFLAFVPAAPTEASVLFDLVVGASSIYGGSWLEGAGAIHAENEALRWLADLAGLPTEAGGCFVSGGSIGNLAALVAARHTAASRRDDRPDRWAVMATGRAHSSIVSAARVMDIDLIDVPTDRRGRLTGDNLEVTLAQLTPSQRNGIFAIVATAGTTNLGIVDDLTGIGEVCAAENLWFHVDGAYGGAALASPTVRDRFAGVEQADSFVVDPHKWLFAPYDCCALIYREPALARAAHTQQAAYLDPVQTDDWNPSDYSIHLSRRARGLPFWFSLATHGTRAYRDAIETTLQLTRDTARLVEQHPHCELLFEPELSVVVFRRVGWAAAEYDEWADRLLRRGLALCFPTKVEGESVLRMCFVNPTTTVEDIELVLGTL